MDRDVITTSLLRLSNIFFHHVNALPIKTIFKIKNTENFKM